MNSLNENIVGLDGTIGEYQNPGFVVIVAFDYYDGPERGLAVYPSGQALRFISRGDSKSRAFRAFELADVDGNWWPAINVLQTAAGVTHLQRVFLPAAGDILTSFENSVSSAPAKETYVAVGTPDLDQLRVCPISDKQQERLRQMDTFPECFQAIHQLIKGYKNESSDE